MTFKISQNTSSPILGFCPSSYLHRTGNLGIQRSACVLSTRERCLEVAIVHHAVSVLWVM